MLLSALKFIKSIPYKTLLFGPWLIGVLGDYSNKLVMVLNHGQMPVRWPGTVCDPTDMEHDFVHACMVEGSHLKVLADIITTHRGVMSVGDMLLDAGDWLFWPAAAIWVALMIKDYSTHKGS